MTPDPEHWPSISESELRLLKLLWEQPEWTVRNLRNSLQVIGQDWAYTTVQTMLHRLEVKGYVSVERCGQAHQFRAAVSRDSLLARRLSELRENLCEGQASPLVLNLVARQKFSSAEIAQLRSLLDEAESSQAGGKDRRGKS